MSDVIDRVEREHERVTVTRNGRAAAVILSPDDLAELEETLAPPLPAMRLALAQTIGGLIVLVIGARLLVDSSTEIARSFGISEAVIGLTIVALGTSLPELATSVIAAYRRQTEIAVGNVIGSNIFNIFSILGITALISPIPADPRFTSVDMPWVAGSALLLIVMAVVLHGIPRLAGAALLLAYASYIVLTAL